MTTKNIAELDADHQDLIVVVIQSKIYELLDDYNAKEQARIEAVNAAEAAASSAEYAKDKLRAVALWLNEESGTDTDYLAEVGLLDDGQ